MDVEPSKDKKYVRFVWGIVLTKLAFETLLVMGIYVFAIGLTMRPLPGICSAIVELAWIFAAFRMYFVRLKDPKSGPENYKRWKKSTKPAWHFFTEVMGS